MPPKKKISKVNKVDLTVTNWYDLKTMKKHLQPSHNPNESEHGMKLYFNSLIIGATGSGKSTCALNLILKAFSGTFNHIYIFSKKEEPIYEWLKEQIDSSMLTVKYGFDEFKNFDQTRFYGQSFILLDDFVCEKKANLNLIGDFIIRSRKLSSTKGGGCCTAFLSQGYFEVPSMVRNNCQYIFILKVPSMRNLVRIIKEYSLNVEKETLIKMYTYCCKQGNFGDFLLIDMHATDEKRFRRNFQEILDPSAFSK